MTCLIEHTASAALAWLIRFRPSVARRVISQAAADNATTHGPFHLLARRQAA